MPKDASKPRTARSPVWIWVAYTGLLAVLTCAEAIWTPETGFDTAMDVGLLLVAFLGAIAAWAFTGQFAMCELGQGRVRWVVWKTAIGWLLGPTCGVVSVFMLNGLLSGDIDGGLALLYLPLLAVISFGIAFPVIVFLSQNRAKTQSQ